MDCGADEGLLNEASQSRSRAGDLLQHCSSNMD